MAPYRASLPVLQLLSVTCLFPRILPVSSIMVSDLLRPGLGIPNDGQRQGSPERDVRGKLQLCIRRQPEVRKSRGELLEGNLRLKARERATETKMRPMAKCEVFLRI